MVVDVFYTPTAPHVTYFITQRRDGQIGYRERGRKEKRRKLLGRKLPEKKRRKEETKTDGRLWTEQRGPAGQMLSASDARSAAQSAVFCQRPNLCQLGARRSVHYWTLSVSHATLSLLLSLLLSSLLPLLRETYYAAAPAPARPTGCVLCLAQENICVVCTVRFVGLAGARRIN